LVSHPIPRGVKWVDAGYHSYIYMYLHSGPFILHACFHTYMHIYSHTLILDPLSYIIHWNTLALGLLVSRRCEGDLSECFAWGSAFCLCFGLKQGVLFQGVTTTEQRTRKMVICIVFPICFTHLAYSFRDDTVLEPVMGHDSFTATHCH